LQCVKLGPSSYACSICGKKFDRPNHCASHVYAHTNEKPFKCPHCQYAANWKGNLHKHIKKQHPKAKPIIPSVSHQFCARNNIF